MKFLALLSLLYIAQFSLAQTTCQKANLPDSLGVTEQVFGKIINDPFRGLENQNDPTVQAWMQRENREAVQTLQLITEYEALKREIRLFRNSANVRSSIPIENNGSVYSLRALMDSGVDQIVSFETPSSSEAKVLFSTATLNQQDSTFYTIYGFEPSPDNRYVAIQLYPDGNDQMEIRVLDVVKEQLLDEVIDASISYFPSWLPDSRSFFYTQLSLPEDSSDLFDRVRVKHHTVDRPQSKDRIMLDLDDHSAIEYQPGDFPVFQMLTDGEHILCSVAQGVSQYLAYYVMPLTKLGDSVSENPWTTLFTMEDQVSETTFDGRYLYSLSHRDSPGGNISRTSLDQLELSERVFSPEEGYINTLKATQHALYVEHIVNGLSHLVQIKEGRQQEIILPFLGNIDLSADGFLSPGNGKGLFFGLSNWSHGYGIYYYDPKQDTVIRTNIRPSGTYDLPKRLIVEEVMITSHDGEKVPMSIIYDKQVQRDGNNPAVLEVYGAYGESMEPYFSVEMLAWYQRGGILAYPHVRGGSEKGIAWHNAGKKKNKPNTWKDLIACAEYLIQHEYTSPKKSGVRGGSAGGIAAGRAMTERPELFGAAVLEYPMVNPTRLDRTPGAVVQEDEFGSPTDSIEFQYLYEMDTYLHVREGKNYPAILLTAGKEDTRILSWEPAKLAARLEKERGNDRVTLLRLYEGGHGTGDTEEMLKNIVDPIAFFLWQLCGSE